MDERTSRRRRRNGGTQLLMVLVMLGLIVVYTTDARAADGDWNETADERADISLVADVGEDEHRDIYLMLEASPDKSWFEDDPEAIGHHGARAPVVDTRLPDAFGDWNDRDVRLFDRDGSSCPATVAELVGLSRVSALGSTIARWRGQPMGADPDEFDELDEDELAEELWNFPGGPTNSIALAGRLQTDTDCELDDPRWAHDTRRDATALVPTTLTDRERGHLYFEFRQTDDYVDIQQRFEDHHPETDRLWTDGPRYTPEIEAFHSREHDRTFAVVRADAGPGCGSFGGRTWELFELGYHGSDLHIERLETSARHPISVAMADPGLEGKPTLVTDIQPWGSPPGEQLVVPGDDGWNVQSTARINTEHTCPC